MIALDIDCKPGDGVLLLTVQVHSSESVNKWPKDAQAQAEDAFDSWWGEREGDEFPFECGKVSKAGIKNFVWWAVVSKARDERCTKQVFRVQA